MSCWRSGSLSHATADSWQPCHWSLSTPSGTLAARTRRCRPNPTRQIAPRPCRSRRTESRSAWCRTAPRSVAEITWRSTFLPSPQTTSTKFSGNVQSTSRCNRALVAGAVDAVVPDQDLAGRREEVAVAQRLQDRAVVVVRSRGLVDLQVVDREVRRRGRPPGPFDTCRCRR